MRKFARLSRELQSRIENWNFEEEEEGPSLDIGDRGRGGEGGGGGEGGEEQGEEGEGRERSEMWSHTSEGSLRRSRGSTLHGSLFQSEDFSLVDDELLFLDRSYALVNGVMLCFWDDICGPRIEKVLILSFILTFLSFFLFSFSLFLFFFPLPLPLFSSFFSFS